MAEDGALLYRLQELEEEVERLREMLEQTRRVTDGLKAKQEQAESILKAKLG